MVNIFRDFYLRCILTASFARRCGLYDIPTLLVIFKAAGECIASKRQPLTAVDVWRIKQAVAAAHAIKTESTDDNPGNIIDALDAIRRERA